MKEIEKLKAQSIINKIQSGNFDVNDVDNLFMRLRAYSNGFKVFREVSDFVAHNAQRDRGLVHTALEDFYLCLNYAENYTLQNKIFDLNNPFPAWIRKLMLYQIEESDENILKQKYNTNKENLKAKVIKSFKLNSGGNYVLGKRTLSKSSHDALIHLLKYIKVKEAYSQDKLIAETIKVIIDNKLVIDKAEFNKQSNYFTLCTLLLLHHTSFNIKGQKVAYCFISPENGAVNSYEDGLQPSRDGSFGNLMILGNVTLSMKGNETTFGFKIMSTNVDTEEFCNSSLFESNPLDSGRIGRKIIFPELSEKITISDDKQLIAYE